VLSLGVINYWNMYQCYLVAAYWQSGTVTYFWCVDHKNLLPSKL